MTACKYSPHLPPTLNPTPAMLFHHRSCAIDMGMEADVLVVRFTGVVTAATLFAAKEWVLTHAWMPSGFLADYRGAVMAVSDDELSSVLTGESPESRVGQPAAIVVRPAALEVFREHCIRATMADIARCVFTEPGPAQTWLAKEIARVRRLRCRRPGTATPQA